MNEIIMSIGFVESLLDLDGSTMKQVIDTIRMLHRDAKGKGLDLHKVDGATDKNMRSVRVSDDIRIIASQIGNKFMMLYVDHHESAYKWAERKTIALTPEGAIYLRDLIAEQEKLAGPISVGEGMPLLVSRGVKVRDLQELGVPDEIAERLMVIADEGTFLNFMPVLPEELQEDLYDLLAGIKSIAVLLAERRQFLKQFENDLETALKNENTLRRFRPIDDAELEWLAQCRDIERWTLFLHPDQEALVNRNFNGPALIEGGPGTGKTVVGIHRAVYLAENVYTKQSGAQILFCTFSVKLASYIRDKVRGLASQKGVDNNIEVWGVDKLLRSICDTHKLSDGHIDLGAVEDMLAAALSDRGRGKQMPFYLTEYAEVIQRFHIRTLDEYLAADRKGLGKPLNEAERRAVWEVMGPVLEEMDARRIIDFADIAYMVCEGVKSGRVPPVYDSIIIDEAQDLTPLQLTALAGLVKSNTNNIMVLSDQNQRIFRLSSWRKDTNLNIVGRTHYLKVNYRTTKQIREYADQQFMHCQMVTDHLRGYKSLFTGPEPMVQVFNDQGSQIGWVVERVNDLLSSGMQPHEICVADPHTDGVNRVDGALMLANIPHTVLRSDVYPKEGLGVGVTTLAGCKGLEFRAVLITNYQDALKGDLDDGADEWYVHREQERLDCLRYVAATRAREVLMVGRVG
jgi:hypothetical protein